MSDKKFILCANCGALLEKEVKFCGYCGSHVDEIKEQPFQQSYTPPQEINSQQQSMYDSKGSSYEQFSTWDKTRDAESNVRLAWMFSWVTFLGGIIFLALTIYYAKKAKQLGSTNPKIRQSIIIASIGAVLSFGLNFAITYIYMTNL